MWSFNAHHIHLIGCSMRRCRMPIWKNASTHTHTLTTTTTTTTITTTTTTTATTTTKRKQNYGKGCLKKEKTSKNKNKKTKQENTHTHTHTPTPPPQQQATNIWYSSQTTTGKPYWCWRASVRALKQHALSYTLSLIFFNWYNQIQR